MPCSCQGKRYTSSNTQFRLATLKSSARKGDRRLSVSSGVARGAGCKVDWHVPRARVSAHRVQLTLLVWKASCIIAPI